MVCQYKIFTGQIVSVCKVLNGFKYCNQSPILISALC